MSFTTSKNASRGKGSHIRANILGILYISLAVATQTCYWPSKTPIPSEWDYLPCGDGNSSCCRVGEVCISNGLCYGTIGLQVKKSLVMLCPGVLGLTEFRRHIGEAATIQIGSVAQNQYCNDGT